ncbi:phage tail tube protein [Sphingomonas sanguinis]|uniref:Uncharacterized protein n=1 Tax=Sphingomonas sanguinis TaxID=33051 RepID=A0A147HYZ6_9SPHN|nr:phage tail tube protein [Sphingomonas sanguinis]KTT70166.1 hypothetical protein NS319_08460 [Sphingomonas sanguinis]
MGRPLGINLVMNAVAETSYGLTPATNFFKLPLVSHSMGEEQGLIEDDQLGFGREGLDPVYDVVTNDGDIVIPVDLRAIGFWLRQTFGPPTTTGPVNGKYTHVFTSGAASLPSTSIEMGNPDEPSWSTNYGAVVNSLKISLSRSGMLNATLSLIAQGETDPVAASIAGVTTQLRGPRFAQAVGNITVEGATAADIVSADLSFSNNLDKVEVIRSDGRIAGVDPGKAMTSGSLTARGPRGTLFTKARAKLPASVSFGWTQDGGSLVFSLPRVFLPKPKRPVAGPKGIQATFNYQASGASGAQLTTTLVNDVASYA